MIYNQYFSLDLPASWQVPEWMCIASNRKKKMSTWSEVNVCTFLGKSGTRLEMPGLYMASMASMASVVHIHVKAVVQCLFRIWFSDISWARWARVLGDRFIHGDTFVGKNHPTTMVIYPKKKGTVPPSMQNQTNFHIESRASYFDWRDKHALESLVWYLSIYLSI